MNRNAAEPVTGLTLTAEMAALGLDEGYYLWTEAAGPVSGLELTVFRGAVAARVRERTTDEPNLDSLKTEDYQPSEHLPAATQKKLSRAHGIGVTVADLLLDQQREGAKL